MVAHWLLICAERTKFLSMSTIHRDQKRLLAVRLPLSVKPAFEGEMVGGNTLLGPGSEPAAFVCIVRLKLKPSNSTQILPRTGFETHTGFAEKKPVVLEGRRLGAALIYMFA